MKKINEQHQFALLYLLYNVFKKKVARALRNNKTSEVTLVLKAIYKKGSAFKCAKSFQCNNGSEFKGDVTKLLEKHNIDV